MFRAYQGRGKFSSQASKQDRIAPSVPGSGLTTSQVDPGSWHPMSSTLFSTTGKLRQIQDLLGPPH